MSASQGYREDQREEETEAVLQKRPRILIVDDSRLILEQMSDLLEDAGYTVHTASTVWIAPVVREHRPDLILMDVMLDTQDGASATEVLRRYGEAKSTPILLYSSKSPRELRYLAEECGADGWIHKGEDPSEIVRKVSDVLARARA